ncbi:MAG: gamma-glutamylcyclotransferase family protein [Candidatus Promineifilaceae bacterium]
MTKRDATGPKLPFFVYGTLMPGQPNDYLWQDSLIHAQPAIYEGRLLDCGYYPVLIAAKGERVMGQLVSVAATQYMKIVAELDTLEGFDARNPDASLFRRVRRVVQTKSGVWETAWLYMGQGPRTEAFPVIPNGDWEAYSAADRHIMRDWWQQGGGVPEAFRAPDDPAT